MLHTHPVATFVIDRNAVLVWANQAGELLCNMSRLALIGSPVSAIIRFDDAAMVRIFDDPDQSFAAYSVKLHAGRQNDMTADIQLVPGGGGVQQRMLAIIPVPRVREVVAVRTGGAGRSATAAGAMLAHEIKNPLSGIRGAAQLIARQAPPESTPFTDLICREVDRIAALIDRMQDFTRDSPRAVAATNLYPAIQQARDIAVSGFARKVRVVEEFDPSIPDALVNHDAIVQALLNLIKNAAEALADTPAPVIRIATAYRHGLSFDTGDGRGRIAVPIEVRISDNGPGVPDSIADDIFSPFVTTKRDGQGLGLALVDKLVRDMGGLVQHSRDIDAGMTHFRIHLPLAKGQKR